MQQPFAVVVAFFREPGVVGKRCQQRLAQCVVDLDVGLGDDLVGAALQGVAVLPAVSCSRFSEALQDLAAAAGGLLGRLKLCSQVRY